MGRHLSKEAELWFHQYHIISTGAADENNSNFKARLWHIVPNKAKQERISSCSSGTAADVSTGLEKDVGIQRGTTTVGVHTFKRHSDSQPDTPFLRFQDEHGHELGAIAQNSTGTTRATRERQKFGPGGGRWDGVGRACSDNLTLCTAQSGNVLLLWIPSHII